MGRTVAFPMTRIRSILALANKQYRSTGDSPSLFEFDQLRLIFCREQFRLSRDTWACMTAGLAKRISMKTGNHIFEGGGTAGGYRPRTFPSSNRYSKRGTITWQTNSISIFDWQRPASIDIVPSERFRWFWDTVTGASHLVLRSPFAFVSFDRWLPFPHCLCHVLIRNRVWNVFLDLFCNFMFVG